MDKSSEEQLAKILSCSPKVIRYNTKSEEEAWTLTHAFSDLDKSFKTFSNDLLPSLLNEDILHDIGEEFRHILYHIRDTRFYKYLDIE